MRILVVGFLAVCAIGCHRVGPEPKVGDNEWPDPRMEQRAYSKLSEEQRRYLDQESDPAHPVEGPGVVRLWIRSKQSIELRLKGPVANVYPNRAYSIGYNFSPRLCVKPCGSVVDGSRGQLFYFAGDGIPDSSPFKVDDMQGEITAVVDGGSSLMQGFGAICLIVATGTAIWFTATAIDKKPEWRLGATSLVSTAAALVLFKSFATKFSFVEGGSPPHEDVSP